MGVVIVGSGHSKFGKLEDKRIEDLIIEVTKEALSEAQLEAKYIDTIFLGNFNAGLISDAFSSSLVHQVDENFRFKPSTRCENACASGSAAIFMAINALNNKDIKNVLVIGAEKMTSNTTLEVTKALSCASYQGNEEKNLSFPQIFALYAKEYEKRYKSPYESMAKIAVKNHKNALNNPLAHIQKELDFNMCNTISKKNPLIAQPLKLSDCSLISDGAAAVILTREENAKNFHFGVKIRAYSQINDFLPLKKRDFLKFEGVKKSIYEAFKKAKLSINDMDFAEVHDCFTIAELLMYEALGIKSDGKGGEALDEGIVYETGKLPVNLSGGLKAKGHPVGATGVSFYVLAFKQLTNQAKKMQKKDANFGILVNMGGAGVTTYTSILERIK